MNDDRASDFEVVGFDGTPFVECGRSLPVVRRKADGMHAVLRLSTRGSPSAWHSAEEADEFAAAGRWTRLSAPLELPRPHAAGSGGPLDRRPMVVYAARTFLDAAGLVEWPTRVRDEAFAWRPLDPDRDSVRASAGFDDTVVGLMDEWASALLDRFDENFRRGSHLEPLHRIADFALCAAESRPLRWKAYTRLAIAQKPDVVRPTFDRFIKPEFPGATWENLMNDIQDLGDVLKRPVPPAATKEKLKGIANLGPIDLKLVG